MARLVVLFAALCALACSVQAKRSMRIVNGKEYDVKVAPFLAQLNFWEDGKEGHSLQATITCGGTIADAFHIVTAAHCLRDFKDPARQVVVRVGATERLKGGRLYAIKSTVQHPKFKNGGFMNLKPWNHKYDVAVITLAEPIDYEDNVEPIAEIATTRVPDNTMLHVGGWGAAVEHLSGSVKDFGPQLKIATVKKPTDEWCKKWFKRALISNIASEAMDSLICALPVDGTVCGGDSGSPLWLPKTKDTPEKLVGLVMGAASCVQAEAVPLFVDIADPAITEFLRKSGLDL